MNLPTYHLEKQSQIRIGLRIDGERTISLTSEQLGEKVRSAFFDLQATDERWPMWLVDAAQKAALEDLAEAYLIRSGFGEGHADLARLERFVDVLTLLKEYFSRCYTEDAGRGIAEYMRSSYPELYAKKKGQAKKV